MTIGAGARRHRVQSGQREPSAVVVERRVHPVAGAVALLAGLWEVRSRVVGIRGSLEILQVARHAPGAVQSVVVVDVTIGAGTWWHGMQSGERKPSAVVVKLGVHPVAGLWHCSQVCGKSEVRVVDSLLAGNPSGGTTRRPYA